MNLTKYNIFNSRCGHKYVSLLKFNFKVNRIIDVQKFIYIYQFIIKIYIIIYTGHLT